MAFDLELECKRARERIHRSIGQRWRYARAETKRMADEARAAIGRESRSAYWVNFADVGGGGGGSATYMALHDVRVPDGPTDGGD